MNNGFHPAVCNWYQVLTPKAANHKCSSQYTLCCRGFQHPLFVLAGHLASSSFGSWMLQTVTTVTLLIVPVPVLQILRFPAEYMSKANCLHHLCVLVFCVCPCEGEIWNISFGWQVFCTGQLHHGMDTTRHLRMYMYQVSQWTVVSLVFGTSTSPFVVSKAIPTN